MTTEQTRCAMPSLERPMCILASTRVKTHEHVCSGAPWVTHAIITHTSTLKGFPSILHFWPAREWAEWREADNKNQCLLFTGDN